MISPYTLCPHCGLITPPTAMEYAVAGPGSDEILWTRPAEVTCCACQRRHLITEVDVLPNDAQTTCRRTGRITCTAVTAHPAGAARICCTGCGLYMEGDVDEATAARREVTEALWGVEAAATVRVARERARRNQP